LSSGDRTRANCVFSDLYGPEAGTRGRGQPAEECRDIINGILWWFRTGAWRRDVRVNYDIRRAIGRWGLRSVGERARHDFRRTRWRRVSTAKATAPRAAEQVAQVAISLVGQPFTVCSA
jgi:hypothetical protein